MDLVLVGLNHRTAPVEVRERLAFKEKAIRPALETLRNEFGFSEALIVSTCNRVEVLTTGSRNGGSADLIKGFLSRYHQLEPEELERYLYIYQNEDLIRHVFRVASSLDSMVPGEAQILGQLKTAFSHSQLAGTAGSRLSQLFPHAFFVAKRVRSETRIGHSAVSVSSVAVELAVKIFGDLEGTRVLLVGAGKMSELAAENILKSGASQIRVSNRTKEKAEAVAKVFQGQVADFSDLENTLVDSDIVIVSTGADHHVLTPEMMEQVVRRRKYAPLFVIDISVPRNVDPRVNEIENIFNYDIDDLQAVITANLEERQQEAGTAEEIISQEVLNFLRGWRKPDVGPLIRSFRQRLEDICLEELDRNRDSFSPEQYQKMERMLLRAAHKIAHPLMLQMKKSDQSEGPRDAAEILNEAFQLEEED